MANQLITHASYLEEDDPLRATPKRLTDASKGLPESRDAPPSGRDGSPRVDITIKYHDFRHLALVHGSTS